MAAISRAQLLKELLPGLNALFGLEYDKYQDEHTQVYDSESSERSFEEETKLSGFGAAPVKKEGMAMAYDTAQESFSQRYDHETIAMGFSITEEAMEDNLYDSLSSRYTKALARAMSYTKQVKAMVPFNTGFTASTGYLTGDGDQLFSTSHSIVSGASLSNRPATAVDLNETSLEDAAIQISNWTDERGLLIAAQPVKLVIPTNLQFVATRILNSQFKTGVADNDINAIVHNSTIRDGYCVNHYLTDTNAWFLKTDVPNGLKSFTRVGMSTSMDGDFDTGNVRYKARERYSFGVSDYLGIYGSPGSS
jgi:hypothetical protein|tara:strand:- start:467 stop:1387 length:921 start_codon:yes stop_codon:yes gene_type:complete